MADVMGKPEERDKEVCSFEFIDKITSHPEKWGLECSGKELDEKMEIAKLLYRIVKILRAPRGCPWDRDHGSDEFIKDVLEEVQELTDALYRFHSLKATSAEIEEEIGDIMLVIFMLASSLEDEAGIDLARAILKACCKLIYRHPHVFEEITISEKKKVLEKWEEIKDREKGKFYWLKYLEFASPIFAAYKLQKRAARKGFDWDNYKPVLEKIEEEIEELKEKLSGSFSKDEIASEIGDLFFALVNLSRHLDVDPAYALRKTNKKFAMRWKYVEENMREGATLDEMEELWQEAKAYEEGDTYGDENSKKEVDSDGKDITK